MSDGEEQSEFRTIRYPIRWIEDDNGVELVADEVYNDPNGLKLRQFSYSRNGIKTTYKPITSCPVQPEVELLIEGQDTQIRLRAGKEIIEGRISDLPNKLVQMGVVLNKRVLSDALGAIISESRKSGLLPIEKCYSAPGCYVDENEIITSIDNAIVTYPEERIQKSHIKDRWGKGTKDAVIAYRNIVNWFDPYEIIPCMGASAVAPFFYELKKRAIGIIIPNILLYGRPGLGKTVVNSSFTTVLWGTRESTGTELNSDFRFNEKINSTTFPTRYSEMESFPFDKFQAKLKSSTESAEFDSRGQNYLGMRYYYSHTTLFMDTNVQPIIPPSLDPRIVRIGFNNSKIKQRQDPKQRNIFQSEVMEKRGCIGHLLVKQLSKTLCNSSVDPITTLINKVREVEKDIANSSVVLSDTRRSFFWGLVWVGIQNWNDLFDSYGLPKLDMTFEEYLEKVVNPIERDNIEEREMGPIAQFQAWFDNYRSDGARYNPYGTIIAHRGKNETWMVDEKSGDVWITYPIVLKYIKYARGMGGLPIFHGLSDLARSVAQTYGGEKEDYIKTKKFNKKARKCVLIPGYDKSDDEEEETKIGF